MSELTRCNRCTLRDMEAHARATGQVVTVVPSARLKPAPRGVDVFVHRPDEKPDAKLHWAAWFWELSDKCVC